MIRFHDLAWEDYLYWSQTDKQVLKRINELIRDIRRDPFSRRGNPEPLKHTLAGCWSRRINMEHRLVCEVDNDALVGLQCRHYD
jgi:toxin YoeB